MRHTALDTWQDTIQHALPPLTVPQARGLAERSFAMATTQTTGLTTNAHYIADTRRESPNTSRQRLRDFYLDQRTKRGKKRRELHVPVTFEHLLRWAVTLLPARARTVHLALDATHHQQHLTILSISVLLHGTGIPVAWHVRPFQDSGSDRMAIMALFEALRNAVPAQYEVLVTADRGLYAPWLYEVIKDVGWHPFLRINAQGAYQLPDSDAWLELSQVLQREGDTFASRVRCFKHQTLQCSLVGYWAPGHEEGWLIVTDLPPDEVSVGWYGLRMWVEAGFKDVKSGGLRWSCTRMRDAARVERMWLAVSVTLLFLLHAGSEGAPGRVSGFAWERGEGRVLSCVRLGLVRLLAAVMREGRAALLRLFPPPPPQNLPL